MKAYVLTKFGYYGNVRKRAQGEKDEKIIGKTKFLPLKKRKRNVIVIERILLLQQHK